MGCTSHHFLLLLLLTCFSANAQETDEFEEGQKGKHRITLAISHAHVPAGIGMDGKKQWLVLPGWGLDYDYWISDQWAIGIHSDFIIENFEFEESDSETVMKRSRPISVAPVAVFKTGKHLTVILGAGAEFAREENLMLVRGGLEYGWELPDNWELGISLINDFKIDAYNSWVIGLGVSRFFRSRKDLE